jgi:hypothetical protein
VKLKKLDGNQVRNVDYELAKSFKQEILSKTGNFNDLLSYTLGGFGI